MLVALIVLRPKSAPMPVARIENPACTFDSVACCDSRCAACSALRSRSVNCWSFGAYFSCSFCLSASRSSRVACWTRMRKSRSLSPGLETILVSESLNRSMVWVAKSQRPNSFSQAAKFFAFDAAEGRAANPAPSSGCWSRSPRAISVGSTACQSTATAPSPIVASTVTPRGSSTPSFASVNCTDPAQKSRGT